MTHNYRKVAIVSAFQTLGTHDENKRAHLDLLSLFHRLEVPHKVVVGCWKGRKELSVIVPETCLAEALVLGQLHTQDSVLVLDNERGAWLLDLKTGTKTFEGYFVPVRKERALKEDSYTLDNNDRYWIISNKTK